MRRTLKLWTFFSASHLGLAAVSTILGLDRLSALMAGTVYLPLWPFHRCGLPVFQRNQWMIPPPNALGWACVLGFWALLYWALAVALNRFMNRRQAP